MKNLSKSQIHMKFDPTAKDPCGIIGKQFGKFTVISYVGYKMRTQMEYFYKVRCSCHNHTVKETTYSDLIGGRQYCCGKCGVRNPVKVGDRYGSLTVLEIIPTDKLHHYCRAVCGCDCDPKTRICVSVNKLKTGHTTSCGGPAHVDETKHRWLPYTGSVEVGDRFGDLEVLEILENERTTYGARQARCLCHRKDPLTGEECGNVTKIVLASLTSGRQMSCGCSQRVFKNPLCVKLRRKLHSMIDRCYNKNISGYEHYGARGIRVCDEWRKNDIAFIKWSLEHGYPDQGDSIERMDVNKDYCPENCCYIPKRNQPENTRLTRFIEYNGQRKSMSEWSRVFGVSVSYFAGKLKHFKGTDTEFVRYMAEKHRSRIDITSQPLTIDGVTKTLSEWGYDYNTPSGFCVYLWKRYHGNTDIIIDELKYWKQTIEMPL